jgi:hypothetical protein
MPTLFDDYGQPITATAHGDDRRPAPPADAVLTDYGRMQQQLVTATTMLARGIERHRAGSSQADEFLDGAYAILKELSHAD